MAETETFTFIYWPPVWKRAWIQEPRSARREGLLPATDETPKPADKNEARYREAHKAWSKVARRAECFPIVRELLADPELNDIHRIGCLMMMSFSDGWQLDYARQAIELGNRLYMRHEDFTLDEIDEIGESRTTAFYVIHYFSNDEFWGGKAPHPLSPEMEDPDR